MICDCTNFLIVSRARVERKTCTWQKTAAPGNEQAQSNTSAPVLLLRPWNKDGDRVQVESELWSHVAPSLMGLQHENTHDFISGNNGAGVRDRITQGRNVALTVQVISSRAEADERLTSAVIKPDGSDGDGHPEVTWLPVAHVTLARNQEISQLKNSHASGVTSWQRFRLLLR